MTSLYNIPGVEADYNITKLRNELYASVDGFTTLDVFNENGSRCVKVGVNLLDPTVISQIDTVVASHDPSLTDEQTAEAELKTLESDKSLYEPFMSLVRQWRDDYEASITGNESLSETYMRYRAIWNNTTAQQQNIIRRHGRQLQVDMAEPTTVTDAYRGQFNQAMMSFMMLVYMRVKS